MGLEFIRGSNTKCPPFLLCGLMVMCLFLGCNWWSLSSQNFELLKQIDNLAEQLRVNADELGKCSQQQMLLDEKLKDSQTKFMQQQIKIEQIKETDDDVKEGYEKVQEELSNVKTKLESIEKELNLCYVEKKSLQKITEAKAQDLQGLRLEINQLKAEFESKDEKIKQLEAKVSNIKNLPKADSLPPLLKEMQTKIKEKANLKTQNNKSNTNDQNYLDNLQDAGEVKIDGDTSLIPADNEDPREKAMKDS